MTAREAMRAALAWLDAHLLVTPVCITIERAETADGWAACISVDHQTLIGAPGELVRTAYHYLVSWTVDVAPGVRLQHIELTTPTTLPPESKLDAFDLDSEVVP